MIDKLLLTEGEKDKVFQMCWQVVFLVLEAELVFLAVVCGAETQHFSVLFVVFLGEETELSDE